MSRRCAHQILQVDSFIDPGGAFCSCIHCPKAFELTEESIDFYLPFTYTSPRGSDYDVVLLVRRELIE